MNYNPIIFTNYSISEFFIIEAIVASLTFNNLPLKGKTPNLSLPTISIPAIANDLAESPSVSISVQRSAYLVPASLASSNLSIPNNLYYFFADNYFDNYLFNFDFAYNNIKSTRSVFFIISSINLSVNSKELPN